MNKNHIGKRIKSIREAHGWNQLYLSKKAKTSNATINSIERRVTRNPRIDTLTKIASALKVSTDDLTGESFYHEVMYSDFFKEWSDLKLLNKNNRMLVKQLIRNLTHRVAA